VNFLSVCSGIEAASLAWHPLGWRAVAFSEIEAFPAAVLAHRYPDVPNWGDMTKFQEWPDAAVDLLVGGTPCQSFSVAGLRKGLADPRGNLALTYLAIADRYRPRWLVWENVPGVFSATSHDAADPCPPDIDLEGDNAPEDGAEIMVSDSYEADETHAFSCLLAGFSELGYGVSYRTLDAQYFGVPQRRRRVFAVGYLGDWRRAAAVLFERHSLSRHSAPRREAGKGTTGGTLAGTSPDGGWRVGADEAAAGHLIQQAYGGGRQSGALDVSTTLAAHGVRIDFEVETFIATTAPPLTRNPYGEHESREGLLVAHTLRGEGFDASEDGTGRGTPLVPVAFDTTQITSPGNYSNPAPGDPCHPLAALAHPPVIAFHGSQDPDVSGDVTQPLGLNYGQEACIAIPILEAGARTGKSTDDVRAGLGVGNPGDPMFTLQAGKQHAIGFSSKDHGGDAADDIAPTLRAMGHDGSHANAGGQVAVAWSIMPQNSGKDYKARAVDVAQPVMAGGPVGGNQGGDYIQTGMQVRRLTPRECERLQGMPDDWTLVPWRGGMAPDGPRYRAIGNSMAVVVMRWIGQRIEAVDAVPRDGAA